MPVWFTQAEVRICIVMEDAMQTEQEKRIFARKGYICRGMVGEGAFSRVYCLEDGHTQNVLACKVSRQEDLLEREARIMSKFFHPLFPKYFGMWQEAGQAFLLMEYVPGSTVEAFLKRRGSFGMRAAVRIGMELAGGLRTLHENREPYVFRDVKPANCMIRQDGRVKLLDFGCACPMGERGLSRAGTPGFAAPEQLRKDEILTAACDIYGWGKTMESIIGLKEAQPLRDAGGRLQTAKKGRKASAARKGNLCREWKEWEEWKERKGMESIRQLLEMCTCGLASGRIPDMRGIIEVLMSLCPEQEDHFRHKRVFWQEGIRSDKNIIMM